MLVSPIRSPIRSAVSGLFERRASGGAVAFDPATLFASGEQGFIYDPSDLSTLFQDAAGTIPVTAPGQVVGRVLDKSGRGNHATQATTAQKPILGVDGFGKYYLEFDGADDGLATATFAITTLVGDTFTGIYHNSGPTQWLDVYLTNQTSDGFWSAATSSSSASPTGGACGTPTYMRNGVNLVAPTRGSIYTGTTNQTVVQAVRSLTFGAATPSGISIGNYASFRLSGKLYASIVRGAVSTLDQVNQVTDWVNSKTGAF